MWQHIKNRLSGRAEDRQQSLARENARLLTSVASLEARYQRIARAAWRAEESERRRLARELHDNLGQALTALKLRLEATAPFDGRNEALDAAAQALEDVRNLSRLLRPPILDDLGLAAALEWLARRMREDAGLPVRLDIDMEGDSAARPEPDIETLLFRVTQEALTNTAKYANASRAEITLKRVAGRLDLTVRDNGDGFDPHAVGAHARLTGDETAGTTGGVGVPGMRDRVAFFGGDFAITSAPGKGTTVRAIVPVTQVEPPAP